MNTLLPAFAGLYENEINGALDRLKLIADPSSEPAERMIREAAMLVRNDRLRLVDTDERYGTVRFTTRDFPFAEIMLMLPAQRAACSIHGDRGCEHTAAAWFTAYQHIGSLSDWLREWRQSGVSRYQPNRALEQTPQAWRGMLDRLTERFHSFGESVPYHIISEELGLFRQQLRSVEPIEQEWKPLFRLYASLYALHAVTAGFSGRGFSIGYDRWQFSRMLDSLIDDIRDSLARLSTSRRLFAADPFYADLEELVRSFTLRSAHARQMWITIYRNVWTSLFTGQSARERELEVLTGLSVEREATDGKSINPAGSPLPLMKAWIAVLLGRPADEIGMPDGSEVPGAALQFTSWLDLAGYLAKNDEPEKARDIIVSLSPLITPYMESVSFIEQRKTAAELSDLCRETDMPEEETAAMLLRCGSAAEAEYAEFLIGRGRYREWAAWHLLNRSSFDRVEMSGLKTLIDEAPMEAISLCHTHVTDQIALKSRGNYREAVRILKKMKRAAKKAGRTDWWNDYLSVLRSRHSRLRALMEEMERGKLTL
ncbi:hypothetical protein ACFFIY_07595 [Bhargavaea ullalensis]|uniref:SWIM-type domain-containing protein n=1 Tax=Bhargavaea ullalensis TaxID=1265685 RepID=A0ABV2GAX5_9BACL